LIKRVALVIAATAGLWVGWQWLFPSDEAQIAAVLERIADGVSNDAEQGGVGRLARAAALANEFAVDVTVDAGPPFERITGREAIVAVVARRAGSTRNLTVTFPDVAIAVAPDRQSATAVVTAEARFDDGETRGMDARELELAFMRQENTWVISAVTVVRPLERLDGR
jgi:hypothetical protein